MKASISAIVSTTEQARKHAGPRTCLIAVMRGRQQGVYAVSPAGVCTYIQPLPKRLRR